MHRSNDGEKHRLIDDGLRDMKGLPPLPSVVQQATALMENKGSGSADLARVVSQDEVITGKILRVVNSAFYGLSGKVSTVSHAVALLGFEQVRLLILGVALFETGKVRSEVATHNRELVGQHSFTCARWAQAIAKHTRYQPVEEAFMGGLLHDVGKVLLAVAEPKQFAAAIKLAHTRHGLV